MTERIPYFEAERRAIELRDILAPACERIEIAGSLRRHQVTVKDIELVAMPATSQIRGGLFEELQDDVDLLEDAVAGLIESGLLAAREVEIHRRDGSIEPGRKMGPRYKALVFEGIPVDLFVVRPPADWGVLFTIRTGPADWSARLVTEMQRHFRRVEDGQLLHAGQHVPCAEEVDFFKAIGQRWLDPPDRRAERVHLRPARAA